MTGKLIAENRRARFDYFLEETFEAGISLTGSEVKSLRLGKANIAESYANADGREISLVNAHIPEYKSARFNHAPGRPRKLLIHRKERNRLMGLIKREGMTLVPLGIYFNARGLAKCELGLAKGKKKADKREAIKQRDWQRDKARLMREKD